MAFVPGRKRCSQSCKLVGKNCVQHKNENNNQSVYARSLENKRARKMRLIKVT